MNKKAVILIVAAFAAMAWSLGLWLGGCSGTIEDELSTTSTIAAVTTTTASALSSTTTTSTTTTTAAPNWQPLGEGVNYEYAHWVTMVYALATDEAGNLYAGGNFNLAGGDEISNRLNRIAKWDGVSWESVGGGVNGEAEKIYAMAYDPASNDLYVGGSFTIAIDPPPPGLDSGPSIIAFNIARWDITGQHWAQMGPDPVGVEPFGTVEALAVDDNGNVYVGGYFKTAGGLTANNIAKWNKASNSWEALGEGVQSAAPDIPASVKALAIYEGDLYVGGEFYMAGGMLASGIARWNTASSTWENIETNIAINSPVTAMAVDRSAGKLYVLSTNCLIGGGTSRNMAAYYDGSWHDLGDDFDNVALGGIAVGADSKVYISVNPDSDDLFPYLSRWSGSAWENYPDNFMLENLPFGVLVRPKAGPLLIDQDGNLIAAGKFSKVGSVNANNIVKRLLP